MLENQQWISIELLQLVKKMRDHDDTPDVAEDVSPAVQIKKVDVRDGVQPMEHDEFMRGFQWDYLPFYMIPGPVTFIIFARRVRRGITITLRWHQTPGQLFKPGARHAG
jgi:hypothetical protein